jgi:hypothetical protein
MSKVDDTKVRLCLKEADRWSDRAKVARNEKEKQHALERRQHYLDKIKHLLN